MSSDFAALTAAMGAGVPELRACLLLSRDGLALASYPLQQEQRALSVWVRVGALGDAERGFAVVGDEVWVFCMHGLYGGVAVADRSARPGLVLQRLEQMVVDAEATALRGAGSVTHEAATGDARGVADDGDVDTMSLAMEFAALIGEQDEE